MKRQIIRNICVKYKETGEIFKSKRGFKPKLDPQHIDFILNLINNEKNIGLHTTNKVIEKFKLKRHAFSPYAIYRILKANKIVFNKNNLEKT